MTVFLTGTGLTLDKQSGQAWMAGYEGEWDDSLANIDAKKLRYKDAATKMAISAVARALHDAGVAIDGKIVDGLTTTGVIVSSNFGNFDTVCRASSQISEADTGNTSPMDLPNASSNIIASSLAIYFGAGALNLTLCSGSASGVDAIVMGKNAIEAGRAKRMIIVGVEYTSDPVKALLTLNNISQEQWFTGAGALILEAESGGIAVASPDTCQSPPFDEGVRFHSANREPIKTIDLPVMASFSYGATGVMLAIKARRLMSQLGAETASICAGGIMGDDFRTVGLTRV